MFYKWRTTLFTMQARKMNVKTGHGTLERENCVPALFDLQYIRESEFYEYIYL